MTRCISIFVLLGFANLCLAAEPADQLPQPHYRSQPTAPPWLAVRFTNTRTGKAVVLRPTRTLLDLLPSFKAQGRVTFRLSFRFATQPTASLTIDSQA